MKICPQIIFLLFSQYFLVCRFLSFIMVTSLFANVLQQNIPGGAFAKCIHDNLNTQKNVQSPQSYDPRLQAKVETNPEVVPVSDRNINKLYLNHYYYKYHWRKSKTHEVKKKNRQQRSLKLRCHNKVLKLLKLWKHISTLAKREVNETPEEDDVYDDEFDETDGIAYIEDSLFDGKEVEEMFKPIRIKVFYDLENIGFANGTQEFARLQTGLEKAVKVTENILSVIPVQRCLLLSRHNICAMYWKGNSQNSGRCAQYNSAYGGEGCLDEFKIPDHHLEGFAVYDDNSSQPTKVFYDNGTGIPDTDIVLYVRSKQTVKCLESGTVAYASFCQLDQFNRPVSGYANFCPQHLTSADFNSEKFYQIVLHEIFHILGFSQKLFDKFQECKVQPTESPLRFERVCEDRNNVVSFVKDWFRILSPAVLRETTNHFNCTGIGGPLEGSVTNKQISSHWESRYLQPSLMTASLGLPHLTVLDRITLAVLKDSGWYEVDFSKADEMFWGKNAGCEFGTTSYCHSGNTPFFCTSSDLVNGCHYLHLDKGVCKSSEFLDSCKIYKPAEGMECWKPANNVDSEENQWKGETYNINSRCFISNLSSESPEESTTSHVSKRSIREEGRCYEHRCNNTQTLEIRVSGSEWVVCPKNKIVKIPGYEGSIRCPNPRWMCRENITMGTVTTGSKSCATVNISFGGLRKWLSSRDSTARLKEFVDKFKDAIHKLVQGNGTTIQGQPYRSAAETITFQLKTDQSIDSSKHACSEAVRRLKIMVTNKVFVIATSEGELMGTHISVKYTLLPCDEIPGKGEESSTKETQQDAPRSPPPPGIIAATAVGAVCVCVFAAVGGVLYWKSTIPRSVGPTTVSAIDVTYQPNRSSITTASDSSVGQIEFPV